MPQTGKADIIYTDLTTSPGGPVVVGYSGADHYTFSGLPGGAQFGFKRQATTRYTQPYSVTTRRYRTVIVGRMGGSAQAGLLEGSGGFAIPENKSVSVNFGGSYYPSVAMGVANSYAHSPSNGYDHKYLAWVFLDTTQGIPLFGWVEVGLSIANYPTGPNVTIYGYAYDDQGNQIPMGALPVPEPAPVGILALGALALGANGVHAWRRGRTALQES